MRLTILSRSKTIPSTRRMVEAARERGHQVSVINPVKVELHLGPRGAALSYLRKSLPLPDVAIPRVAHSVASYGLAVVDQLQLLGTHLMNGARAIGRARSSVRCLQRLIAAGVPVPATVMARDAKDLKQMVSLVGGVPVLVKLLVGHERRGVMVCETLTSLKAALEAVIGLGHNLVLQEYVRARSTDVRVLVVGGQALAAVRRQPRTGTLRRSLFTGARLEAVELTPAFRSAAEKAARVSELEVCAVDMLDAEAGPKVFEVNPSPALPEMEQATGVDLAGAIITRAEALFHGKATAVAQG